MLVSKMMFFTDENAKNGKLVSLLYHYEERSILYKVN